MTTYKATYSPDDNKLRFRVSDNNNEKLPKELSLRVRGAGFIWAPVQKLFVCPAWSPKAEDLALELAGEIGDEDTSLTERAEERAERFDDYSDKREADAERAHEAVTSNPAFVAGQPIHVGHHSQRRAERDAERIENGMKKAVKLWETSKYWTERAAGALRHAKYKEEPGVRARRIKTLEADQRKQQRSRKEFADLLTLYTNPETADLTTRDGRNLRRATLQASGGGLAFESQTALEKGTMSYEDALARALNNCRGYIAYCDRWISHLENRLTYEKVMLDDQGASDLIAPKARPKQLPLCNYRAPDGLETPDPYRRGEMEKLPQKEMTSAEYAKVYDDYKGTRVIDRSHRVRVAMFRRPGEAHYITDRVCVFLTDSKVHPKPAAGPEAQPREPRPFLYETRAYIAPQPTKFDALKESLRHGVKAVSAPQLFPTPPDLAARLVEAADVEADHRVLEPSAGTGNLLRAIQGAQPSATCVAVELSHPLAATLHSQFPSVKVHQTDFLQCNGDLGTFDRIVMNPPFAKGADIEHVEHALHMLNPGGRLVAIMSAGVTFRQDAAGFRSMVDERGGTIEDLPEDSFIDSGTGVRTVLVTIDA